MKFTQDGRDVIKLPGLRRHASCGVLYNLAGPDLTGMGGLGEIKIEGFGGRPPFGGRPGALGPMPPLNPALQPAGASSAERHSHHTEDCYSSLDGCFI